MKIISVDPSSTSTGWAMFERGDVTKLGLIKPKGKDYWDRIVVTSENILKTVSMNKPDHVIIESSSKSVHRAHVGRGAGLAHYGEAVGAVCGYLIAWGHEITRIDSGVWTRSYRSIMNPRRQASKEERRDLIDREFSQYKPADDPRMDVADAIALGAWWLRENRLCQTNQK